MLQNLMTKLVIISLTNKHNYKQQQQKSLYGLHYSHPSVKITAPPPPPPAKKKDYINELTIWKLNPFLR